MPYTLVHTEFGTLNKPVTLSSQITVPTLAIEVRNRSQRNPHWRSAGKVQAVCFANVGEVRGQAEWVPFGRTEFRLEIPGYPYQVVFTPNNWVYAWDLELYTKDRSGSDGTPTVPLTEATSTDVGWVIW